MMDNWKEFAGHALENLSVDIVQEGICVLLWGEQEMPECLRKEVEDNAD